MKPFALALCLLPGLAQAQMFDLYAARWNYDIEGTVTDSGDTLDLQDDLAVEPRKQDLLIARWDTPGRWPDLALHYTPIRVTGQTDVTTTTTFGPIVLDETTSTALTDADLKDLDLAARMRWDRNNNIYWLGAAVKRIKGSILVSDADNPDNRERQPVNQTFPLLHAAAWLPYNDWLAFEVEAQAVSYQGDKAIELRVAADAAWRRLRLTAGWQRKDYEFDGGRYRIDAELCGFYLGAGFALP